MNNSLAAWWLPAPCRQPAAEESGSSAARWPPQPCSPGAVAGTMLAAGQCEPPPELAARAEGTALCMWQLHLSTSNYQPFWNKKKFYVNHVRAEVSITEQELTEEEYALSFHFFSFEKSNFSFLKNELSFPLLPVFLFIFLPVSHSAKKPELTFVFSVMVPHTFSHPPALQLHFLPVSGFIFILFPFITAPFSHLIGFLAIQNMVRNITILHELHSTKNINYTRNIYFVF